MQLHVTECAMVESLDEFGRSALHYAAVDKDVRQASQLIAAGADIDRQDNNGFTPLHFAAQESCLEIASLLIDAHAEVDIRDKFGNTPLFRAVFNSRGNGDLIRLLRRHGADPIAKNDSGVSPVGLARTIGNYDVAQFFADLPHEGG
jgi:ankyrin repeat protein